MIFSMEQIQDGVWVNIGYGEFSSLNDALADTAEFAENMGLSLECLRVQIQDEIPKGVLVNCDCGGRVKFTADCRTICETCHKITNIGENK